MPPPTRGPRWYLVTIATGRRSPVLGSVCEGQLTQSRIGQHVMAAWDATTRDGCGAHAAAFQLMPDHVHIVVRPDATSHGVSEVVRRFKARATVYVRRADLLPCRTALWQREFHARLLRSQRAVDDAIAYVNANPERWSSR